MYSLIKSDRCSYYTGYRIILDAIRYNPVHHSFKIFRRFWLAPFLRLIFHNQRALTIRTFILPGRSEQLTNDSMVYLIGNEASWAIDHRPKWRLLLSEDEIDEFLTKTERKKCKSTQNVLHDEWDQRFWEVSARYNTCLYPTSYPETATRNGPKFGTNVASLGGGKLVKNFLNE